MEHSPCTYPELLLTKVSVQKIMDKFEFFPIKCRIQRATEIFLSARPPDPFQETEPGAVVLSEDLTKKFKMKVKS